MIRYFYGENTYTARAAIDELAATLSAKLAWLDREDLDQQSFSQRVGQGTTGLFGRQLLVVRDASRLPKAMQTDITRAAGGSGSEEVVIWDRQAPDKRAGLWRELQKNSRGFSHVAEPELINWLLSRARQAGVTLEAAAAISLIRRLGVDQWRLSSELDKLILTANPVTAAQVETAITVGNAETQIFSLLDALAGGKSQEALGQLQNLLQAGEDELYILSMLAYQFRTLLLIKSGLAADAGINPYVIRRQTANAKRFSLLQLQEMLTKILATDFSIKQGKIDPRTGVTMLILGFLS